MVKIYKGIVIYENIGNVIIPDGVMDDLTVNNIATINTLKVEDVLGMSTIKLNSGTIRSAPVSQYDIVNKKYVDDNEGTFDPTQHIILTGNPNSLTVKKAANFQGTVNIDDNVNYRTNQIQLNSAAGYLKDYFIYFKNSDGDNIGSIQNNTTNLSMYAYNNNDTITNNKLLLMSGGGTSFSDYNYNKGIEINNNGLEIKGNTTFDNNVSMLGNLTTTGGIKSGSGNTEITLDTQTGEVKGTYITSTGNITAGTGNNQMQLTASSGKITCNSLEAKNYIDVLSSGFNLVNNNSSTATFRQDLTNNRVRLSSTKEFHIYRGVSETYDGNTTNTGLRLSSTGINVKGNTTFENNITTTGNITAGSSTNQITLDTSNGTLSGRSMTLSNGLTAGGICYHNNSVHIIGGSNSLVLKNAAGVEWHGRNGANDDTTKILRIEGYNNAGGYKAFDIHTNNTVNIHSTIGSNGLGGWSSNYARGIQIVPYDADLSENGGMTFKGNCTFNNKVSLSGGGTIGAPTNNDDIVNKAYVDSMISGGGLDPSQTLTLQNQDSLITYGDITSRTMIKTIDSNGTGSITNIENQYNLCNYGTVNPAGMFYDPKNQLIYSTVNVSGETDAYLSIRNLNLSTTTDKQIKDPNNNTFSFIHSLKGYYDYFNNKTTVLISGQKSGHNYFTFFDYDDYVFTEFKEVKVNSTTLTSAPCAMSFDGKYIYFYEPNSGQNTNIIIYKKDSDTFALKTNLTSETITSVLPLNTLTGNERLLLICTQSKLYLYAQPSNLNNALVLCLEHQFTNDTSNKTMIYGEDKYTIYLFSSKIIHRCSIIKTSSSPYYTFYVDIVYDNTSSNYTFDTGIIHYDGTLYMSSHYSSDQTIMLSQFAYDTKNYSLRLIASNTTGSTEAVVKYNVLVNNKLFVLLSYYSGQRPFVVKKYNKLNNSSILSSNQTSLNGSIRFNSQINEEPFDVNEVITYGKLLKILNNCTIFGAFVLFTTKKEVETIAVPPP